MKLVLPKSFLSLLLLGSTTAFTQNAQSTLFQTMQSLDTQLFEAANHCDYEKLTAMVDENLEFYHDQAGLMLGRQAFLDSIKNNTCGVMIRELVLATLEVYPIKNYGAIEMGVHRFHHTGHEKESSAAKQLGMTRFLDPGAAEWPRRRSQISTYLATEERKLETDTPRQLRPLAFYKICFALINKSPSKF